MSEPGYTQPGYFELLYARDPDPWRFATSDYERDKYAATLAALPPGRFRRAFEIGCSIGVFTKQLAARCDDLLAVDLSETALAQARQRCPSVAFAAMDVCSEWPEGRFDLIVCSEVLYYLGVDGIARVAELSVRSLTPGGSVVLVNWSGNTDAACTGEEAAEAFIYYSGLTSVFQRRSDGYRLDVLTSAPADPSTAPPTR